MATLYKIKELQTGLYVGTSTSLNLTPRGRTWRSMGWALRRADELNRDRAWAQYQFVVVAR